MAERELTRVFSEEDVHELMLRAYVEGWADHEEVADARAAWPDPEVNDFRSAAEAERLRADYTPRQPITEELVARSYAERLARAYAAVYVDGLCPLDDERAEAYRRECMAHAERLVRTREVA